MSMNTATRAATAALLTPPLLALAVTLAACAAPATAPQSGQGPADEAVSTEAVAAPDTEADGLPADEDGPLLIYSGRKESLVGPLIERFEEETGIRTEVRYAGTPALAAALREESEASPADIFYAQDPGGLGAVADMLAPLPEDLLAQVEPRFRDEEGRWIGVSGRARVIVYNRDRVAPEEVPAGLQDLTDPAWRGRLGWAPANGSFQTMVTGMRSALGEEETRAWLEAMMDNEVQAYEDNSSIVAAVGAGEIDAGLVNHYYLYRFLAESGESFPARNAFPGGDDPGGLVMVSGAGILDTAGRPAAAEAFLRYLLSPEAQEYFVATTYEYPVLAEVAPAEGLPAPETLGGPDLPPSELADLEGTAALLRNVGALP